MSGTQHEHEHKEHEHLLTCEACGARVPALRRGRCPFCYLRWSDTRPVGLGAACIVCGERRRDDLRSVEFQRKWVTMCHNCATKTFRMQPLPRTVEAIRQRLSRDRRWVERRVGRTDHRIFSKERRVGERRQSLPNTLGEYIDATDLVVEIVEEIPGAATESSFAKEATRIASDAAPARSPEDSRAGGARREEPSPSEKVVVETLSREEADELEAIAAELAAAEAAEEVEAFDEKELIARVGGEIFDDDDDLEDEVFVRDGKRGKEAVSAAPGDAASAGIVAGVIETSEEAEVLVAPPHLVI